MHYEIESIFNTRRSYRSNDSDSRVGNRSDQALHGGVVLPNKIVKQYRRHALVAVIHEMTAMLWAVVMYDDDKIVNSETFYFGVLSEHTQKRRAQDRYKEYRKIVFRGEK